MDWIGGSSGSLRTTSRSASLVRPKPNDRVHEKPAERFARAERLIPVDPRSLWRGSAQGP